MALLSLRSNVKNVRAPTCSVMMPGIHCGPGHRSTDLQDSSGIRYLNVHFIIMVNFTKPMQGKESDTMQHSTLWFLSLLGAMASDSSMN